MQRPTDSKLFRLTLIARFLNQSRRGGRAATLVLLRNAPAATSSAAHARSGGPLISRDYRIGEGGLLRRFEVAAKLTRVHRQLVALLCITWLPIVILGVWGGESEALVHDPAVHVRLLIVAPVFLVLDQVFPSTCRYTLTLLQDQGYVAEDTTPRVDALLSRAARLADSWIPEALLALGGVLLGVLALLGILPIRGLSYRTGLSADQVWYALTDLPLFQFLLWRSVWRWAIWVRVLAGLSRIELRLVPTHPDRAGGIRFLKLPSMSYCTVLLFAVSSVLCAEWGSRLTLGATLESFKPLMIVFAAVAMLIAFGPLLLFAPQLFAARQRGLREVGSVAGAVGRSFRDALLDANAGLDGAKVQDVASVEQAYRETVKQLSLILFDKRDLVLLLAATLLPLIPLMLLHVPPDDWQAILGVVTGFVP